MNQSFKNNKHVEPATRLVLEHVGHNRYLLVPHPQAPTREVSAIVEGIARILAGDEADRLVFLGKPHFLRIPEGATYATEGQPQPLWHHFIQMAEKISAYCKEETGGKK